MKKSFSFVVALYACVVLLGVSPAHAHAQKTVGSISFELGWGDEPAYSGFKNSVQFLPSDAKTGKPIVDLGDTMKVEVKFGDQTKTLSFEPNFSVGEFGEPGDYRAWIIPTRPGSYIFHLTGTVHGQKIDATLTSGEKTFDDLKEPLDVQFPAQDPSNAQLADKLERGLARGRDAASDKASKAAITAYIGIALGLIALVVALAGRRKKA